MKLFGGDNHPYSICSDTDDRQDQGSPSVTILVDSNESSSIQSVQDTSNNQECASFVSNPLPDVQNSK
jgi:hypothetical protein